MCASVGVEEGLSRRRVVRQRDGKGWNPVIGEQETGAALDGSGVHGECRKWIIAGLRAELAQGEAMFVVLATVLIAHHARDGNGAGCAVSLPAPGVIEIALETFAQSPGAVFAEGQSVEIVNARRRPEHIR